MLHKDERRNVLGKEGIERNPFIRNVCFELEKVCIFKCQF